MLWWTENLFLSADVFSTFDRNIFILRITYLSDLLIKSELIPNLNLLYINNEDYVKFDS